jgi:hypothetical protein
MDMQTVDNEYTARYLEQLGVSPSSHTLNLVRQNVPLTPACVATTLRSKGHVHDEIKVQTPSVSHQPKVSLCVCACARALSTNV